jgi:hypothetical protein
MKLVYNSNYTTKEWITRIENKKIKYKTTLPQKEADLIVPLSFIKNIHSALNNEKIPFHSVLLIEATKDSFTINSPFLKDKNSFTPILSKGDNSFSLYTKFLQDLYLSKKLLTRKNKIHFFKDESFFVVEINKKSNRTKEKFVYYFYINI